MKKAPEQIERPGPGEGAVFTVLEMFIYSARMYVYLDTDCLLDDTEVSDTQNVL